MTSTIFWYDFETTGTDPARDRAIQFAGVRTDLDLNVVAEPVNLFCYPGDDVIPAPEAIMVTGIRMSELETRGLTETEFAGRILAELGQPGTCSCGYNSIRFDDEFTRHLFYRNFIDPYAREWQGNNSRWDLIDVFRMAQALRPDGINWPRNEEGAPLFRLEALTAANGVAHQDAHEALSDVMATIEMARKVKTAQPKLFDFLFTLRRKQAVIDQLYPLGKFPVVHASSMYGGGKQFLSVVLPLCTHPTNSNGVICYDLTEDPKALIELGPDALHRRLFTRGDKLGEDESRIALKTVHINRSPAVAPIGTLTESDAQRLGISLEQCRRHQGQIMSAGGIVEKVQEAFGRKVYEDATDPDLMLYGGPFFSDADRTRMAELRSSSPAQLADGTPPFDDSRLPEMLFRYRARNFPNSLNEIEEARWFQHRRYASADGERVRDVLRRIELIKEQDVDTACLDDLAVWLQSRWATIL